MPFEPKIIPIDEAPLDEAGELDLPGDLVQLGERLQQQADWLATCYPAGPRPSLRAPGRDEKAAQRPAGARPPASSGVRAGLVRGAGAAAVLALLVAGWSLWSQWADNRGGPLVHGQKQNPVNQDARPAKAEGGVAEPDPGRPAAEGKQAAWHLSPASLLQDLSGPELEGLLDLWESQAEGTTHLSL